MSLVRVFSVVVFVCVLGCTPTKVHVFGTPSQELLKFLEREKYQVKINRQHADFDFTQNVLIVPLGYESELENLVEGMRDAGISIDKQVYGSLKDHHYHEGNIGLYLLPKIEPRDYMSVLPAVGENRFKKYTGRYYSIDCEAPVELALSKLGAWMASAKGGPELARGSWGLNSAGLIVLDHNKIRHRYSVMARPDLADLRQLLPVDHHKVLWRCQYRGPMR